MTEFTNEMGETTGETDLPASEQYRLLASDRRRLVLDVLDGRTTAIALEELAAEVVTRESGRGATDKSAIERVAVSLHHVHLPKLADAGVVNYDPVSHRIDPKAGAIEPVRTSPTNDR